MKNPFLPLLLGCATVLSPACSDDESYAHVSVLSATDPIENVGQLRVHASLGGKQDLLNYPKTPTGNLILNRTTPVTFTIGFKDSYQGLATIEVEALAKTGENLGYGRTTAQVGGGNVARVEVRISPAAIRVTSGGTTPISCAPTNPAAACGPNMTCGLPSCAEGEPIDGLCFPAGPGLPGNVCVNNSDCGVGSQCFSFEAKCQVRTCLRYCNADSDCGEVDSYCNTPLNCGARICSRPCDPTGTATTGCTSGLACFIYTGETTDCACPSSRAQGAVGATCTTDDQCAAGNVCVLPQGRCNPVCKRSAPACPTGTTCTALTGYTKYGACL